MTKKKSSTYTTRHSRYRSTPKGRAAASLQRRRWRVKQKLLVEAYRLDQPRCADCRLESRNPMVFFVAPNEDVLVCHTCAIQRREEIDEKA